MEKKTKHRMLGMLVVIGLVLISLPLFQGGKEAGTSNALIKAPPFPDQTVQVSSNTAAEANMPPIQPSPIPLHDPSKPTDNGGFNQQPDDTIKVSPETATSKPNTEAPAMTPPLTTEANVDPKATKTLPLTQAVKNGIESEMVDKTESTNDTSVSPEGTDYIFKNSTQTAVPPDDAAVIKKTKMLEKPHHNTVKMRQANNSLIKLKNAVWVIQVGSFKNKENALRLVNKLRMNGYRAFIQHATSYTQVFVGPESKQNSARVLKRQLEMDLHISGIVVSYKPLTL